jgi:hypothetical protein
VSPLIQRQQAESVCRAFRQEETLLTEFPKRLRDTDLPNDGFLAILIDDFQEAERGGWDETFHRLSNRGLQAPRVERAFYEQCALTLKGGGTFRACEEGDRIEMISNGRKLEACYHVILQIFYQGVSPISRL